MKVSAQYSYVRDGNVNGQESAPTGLEKRLRALKFYTGSLKKRHLHCVVS
jgi:hypothetical protein